MTEDDNRNQNPHPSPSPNENDAQKNKDVPIDIRAMLGTDAMKACHEKRRRVRWRLAINIAILAGIAVMALILLPFGESNGPAREEIEQEMFMVSKSLDILAGLQEQFFRTHGRYASESELAAAYPVVKMHIKSIEANNYRLEFQVSAKSFSITAESLKPDPHRSAFEVSSSD